MVKHWKVVFCMTNIVAGDKSKPRRYPRQKESGVENIAKDLNDHFFNNPEAGDTVEGIADWWVARQRRSNAITLIQEALEFLVEEGSVRKLSYGNREIYSANNRA
jgi:hypothetical protein